MPAPAALDPQTDPIGPASLSLVQRFMAMNDTDSEEENTTDSTHIDHPLLSSAQHDGVYYDANSQEIMFSAGEMEDNSSWHGIRRVMEDLDCYDHEVLFKSSTSAAEMFGRNENDSTVPTIIAEFQALGL